MALSRSTQQLVEVRRLLEVERSRALASMAASERNMLLISDARHATSTDDEHDPEGVTLAFERSQESALASLARDRLAGISAAMEKLDTGTYGACERCGGDIAFARLQARPAATHCIECARRLTQR